jgi:hypothetical protein
MEKIINYKVYQFFQLKDTKLVQDYLTILELLKPLKEINNPMYKWYKRNGKKLRITPVKKLTFGEVTTIRDNFNIGSIDSIIESIKLVTGLKYKHILNFTITDFYGIISYIKSELIEITNMEINELTDDSFDINVESVNAKERMSKFKELNVIDSLAKEDLLRWGEIEKLPYLTVFTKLRMDNEKNKIQSEISELQRKQQMK